VTTKFLHDFIGIFFLIILLKRFIQKVITFQIHYFVGMDDTFDREKIVDCMFDPITSSILAELEDGEKECSFLAQQSSISELEVLMAKKNVHF
jgi:hypothetical protein